MPTYEYKCEDCEHVQEEFHAMSGPNYEITCNKCNSKNIKKILSTFYAMFEGPGWETNDNRGIAKTQSGDTIDSGGM